MSYVKSALIGLGVGIVLGVVGLIPFIGAVNCILSPLLALAAGYFIVDMCKIRKEDWGALAINSAVFSIVAAIVGAVFGLLSMMFGIGISAIGGGDAGDMMIGAGLGIAALVMGVVFGFIQGLVLAIIGGAIKMFTSK